MNNKDIRIVLIEVKCCFDCPYIDLTGLGYFCCYKKGFKISDNDDDIKFINNKCELLKYKKDEIYMIKSNDIFKE